MRKAFQVKVRSLNRILKEYRNYQVEVQAYNLNEVSQDKKKQEFYNESRSALDQVEKKLIDYFQQLRAYLVTLSLSRTTMNRPSSKKKIPLSKLIMLPQRHKSKRYRPYCPQQFE